MSVAINQIRSHFINSDLLDKRQSTDVIVSTSEKFLNEVMQKYVDETNPLPIKLEVYPKELSFKCKGYVPKSLDRILNHSGVSYKVHFLLDGEIGVVADIKDRRYDIENMSGIPDVGIEEIMDKIGYQRYNYFRTITHKPLPKVSLKLE